MTISSLSSSLYSTLLAGQSSASNSSSATTTGSESIGEQLLSAVAQSHAASGTSSNSLLQDLVSLSPAAQGQTDTTPQTYNAQGLLQQMQSNMMLNDPLLQSDATNSSGTNSNDSLLQNLMSVPQMPATATDAAGTTTAAASTHTMAGSGTAAVTTPTAATTPGSTGLNANWSQMLKQDPALANVLVQSQID